MKHLTRRSFLKKSALATGVALSARSWGQVIGANSEVRIAIIGLNGKGRDHFNTFRALPGVRVVAICDVDSAVLDRAKAAATAAGVTVRAYTDLRELLAEPDIDAVSIVTPNHLHALQAIWALQAGKDVLVEKPVSHNIWEGRQLVAAANKYNRVVQTGTQIRSGQGLIDAVAWVRAGNLGKITAARGFCYKRRESLGKTTGPATVPPTVNYDLWCGPAPLVPPHRNTPRNGPLHYDWHWIWAYGNGDIGNQGAHQMDVARWFLGESGLPRHTLSIGGRLGYDDDGETANTQVVVHDYASAPLIFEVRGLPAKPGPIAPTATGPQLAATMDKYRGVSIGNIIDCEGGSLVTDTYFEARALDRDGKLIREFKGATRLMANFIDVVRSRKMNELYGPIAEGHVSSALCHLSNISHQLGRGTPEGELREKIKGNAALSEAYGRLAEHLAVNQVDLAKTPLTLGAPLTIDPARERFTGEGAAAANALLTRSYRAPFVVPQVA